jgi:hypothetical protein
MKPWLSLCTSLLSLALVAASAAAQTETQPIEGVGKEANPLGDDVAHTRFLIGPVFGLNYNQHSGGFRILDGATCPKFVSGTAWGYMAGISAELQRSSGWSVIPRLTYESRPAHFKEVLPDAKVLPPDQQIPVTQTVTASSDVTYKLINLSVMYSHEVLTLGRRVRISLAAGPAAAWVLDAKIRQVQDLVEPLNAIFLNPDSLPTENSGRRLVYKDNDPIPNYKKMRFSLEGGLYAEIGLFNDEWIMTPGVYYDYGLSHVTGNENWNLNTIIFQIDFRHSL